MSTASEAAASTSTCAADAPLTSASVGASVDVDVGVGTPVLLPSADDDDGASVSFAGQLPLSEYEPPIVLLLAAVLPDALPDTLDVLPLDTVLLDDTAHTGGV
jgi:hypothetical protein